MADGSQLRRRVRMATADEPIDNRAIANQAADELRAQIEASPIGERLERVVEEDRPLASRVASAETPLVEEPDTSPSAREISFHLTQPTGRGAVRSALRTPGLAADLRPRTPFGEDETGIAPEPVVTAKPEAADADILEPEQVDEQDRSPAGPDRDATAQNEATDELADLHRAQRRDRRMAIAGGVLRGVQALGAILGRVTGAPGLAGLGGMAGVASGVIPQGRAVEAFGQEHALRREQDQASARAEQTAYDRARNEAADALADRRVRAYEDAVAASAANTQIRESREDRAARTAAEKADEERRVAEADRGGALQQLANAMSRHAVATGTELEGDAFAAARARVGDAPASAIRELADQYDAYTRDAERASPRRSGGGGGGGSSASIAALRQQLIEGGADEASVNAMSPRDIRALERERQKQRLLHPEQQQPTGDGQPQVDRSTIIPGWTQHDQAPALSVAEQAAARRGAAGYAAFQANMRIIAAAIPRVTAADIGSNAAGVRAQAIQDIRNAAASVQATMRDLQGLGVPSAAELAMVKAQLPSPDADPRTWANYNNAVVSLARQIQRETNARMEVAGYRRAAR